MSILSNRACRALAVTVLTVMGFSRPAHAAGGGRNRPQQFSAQQHQHTGPRAPGGNATPPQKQTGPPKAPPKVNVPTNDHSGRRGFNTKNFTPVPFPNGNTGINGSGQPNRGNSGTPVTPIPFQNGNTGINGSGAPQSGFNAGSPLTPIPFKNGNTGINGSGAPQPGLNSSGSLLPANRYYNPNMGFQGQGLRAPPAGTKVESKPPVQRGAGGTSDASKLSRTSSFAASDNTQLSATNLADPSSKTFSQLTTNANKNQALNAFAQNGGKTTTRSFDPLGAVASAAEGAAKTAQDAATAVGGAAGQALGDLGIGNHTVTGTGPPASSSGPPIVLDGTVSLKPAQDTKIIKHLVKRPPQPKLDIIPKLPKPPTSVLGTIGGKGNASHARHNASSGDDASAGNGPAASYRYHPHSARRNRRCRRHLGRHALWRVWRLRWRFWWRWIRWRTFRWRPGDDQCSREHLCDQRHPASAVHNC